jgi:hypothetical protein
MGETRRRLAKRFGQFSFAAFGVTFLIIGGFFVHVAITADPSEIKGIGGALRTLEQQPYGHGSSAWSPPGSSPSAATRSCARATGASRRREKRDSARPCCQPCG